MIYDNEIFGHSRKVLAALSLAMMWGGMAHAVDQVTVVADGEESTTPLDLSAPASGDTHTLRNAGIVRDSGPYWELGWPVVLSGSGEGRVFIENDGNILGRINFSNLIGGVEFDNRDAWNFWNDPGDVVNFSAGSDLLNNEGTIVADGSGSVEFGAGNDVLRNSGSANWSSVALNLGDGDDVLDNRQGGALRFGTIRLDFGAGDDELNNAGTITFQNVFEAGFIRGLASLENSGLFQSSSVGNRLDIPDLQTLRNSGSFEANRTQFSFPDLKVLENTGTLTVFGTEEHAASFIADQLQDFTNSGSIVMSDGVWWEVNIPTKDRLIAPGTNFVASEGSRVVLDAILDGGMQQSCVLDGGSRQADCLSFAGGATSGVTLVTVHGIPVEDGGAYSRFGTALIDVSGGVSHAGDFVLDPASPGFDPDGLFGGGVRSNELFTFNLIYDEGTQVHRLVGIPDAEFLSPGVLPAAAQELWRLGSGVAAARASELRQAASEAQGGFWAKYANADGQRGAHATAHVLGLSDTVAADYEQSSHALSLGADIVGAEGEQGYAVGISLGEVRSKVRFSNYATSTQISGMTINLYSSYRRDKFFFDISGGGYAGDVEGTLVVGGTSKPLDAQARVFGARTEAGWRWKFGESLVLEPLVGLVYVRSALGDLERLQGSVLNALQFDASTSLRSGVGARGSLGKELGGLKLGFSMTGRMWHEFDGEAESKFRTRVDAMPISSSFDGTFTEISALIDLTSNDGTIGGYLDLGSQFGDDYDSTAASLGIRYNW